MQKCITGNVVFLDMHSERSMKVIWLTHDLLFKSFTDGTIKMTENAIWKHNLATEPSGIRSLYTFFELSQVFCR